MSQSTPTPSVLAFHLDCAFKLRSKSTFASSSSLTNRQVNRKSRQGSHLTHCHHYDRHHVPVTIRSSDKSSSSYSATTSNQLSNSYDVIVIGSGLGGLSTASLLTVHSRRTLVLEANINPGGAAHSFRRKTSFGNFDFLVGPHLFSGLSTNIRNPMHSVLRASGIDLKVKKYSHWGVFLGDLFYKTPVTKSEPFLHGLLNEKGRKEVDELLQVMRPLGELATALPPALIRPSDFLGSIRMILPRLMNGGADNVNMVGMLKDVGKLSKPFSHILNEYVSDEFAKRFMNLLCFLLAGVDAERIPTAEIAFMLREWVPSTSSDNDDLILEHPMEGGASAIANALVKAIENSGTGSSVRTNSKVERIIVDESTGIASGVQLSNGEIINSDLIISNASTLDTPNLLPEPYKSKLETQANSLEMCDSFMHLNMAIPLSKIPKSTQLLPNYVVIADNELSNMKAPGNIVLVSIPSVIDDTTSPPGYATVHAYTPATEPYGPWSKLKPNTIEYEEFRKERSKPLFNALNLIFNVDNISDIAIIEMIGTPKTHEKFLNRKLGTYGPAVDARLGMGLPWPGGDRGGRLPRGVRCVGDGVFPGVGVPAVAGSAWMVVNDVVSFKEHKDVLDKIGL